MFGSFLSIHLCYQTLAGQEAYSSLVNFVYLAYNTIVETSYDGLRELKAEVESVKWSFDLQSNRRRRAD